MRFAERVLYKLPADGPETPADKLSHRWKHGHVVGYRTTGNDYDVLDEEKRTMVVARSVHRVTPSDWWRTETR